MLVRDVDDRVISLAARRAQPSQPDCFSALDAHWAELADGRIMPHRDDLSPHTLSSMLDRSILLERIAPGMARIRYAGQTLSGRMGMDLRGMPFSALFTPAARDRVRDGLTALFDEPARCEFVVQGQRQGLRGRIAGQALLLPLRDRAGNVTRAIGCLSLGGPDRGAPQRLDIVGEDFRTLIGYGTKPLPASATPADAPFEAADTARDTVRRHRDVRAMLRVVSNDA